MNRLQIQRGSGALLLGAVLLAGPVHFLFAETPISAPAAANVVEVGNKICPVSGRKANPKYTADYNGKRYAFCSQDCVNDFNKDPEKYLAKMKA